MASSCLGGNNSWPGLGLCATVNRHMAFPCLGGNNSWQGIPQFVELLNQQNFELSIYQIYRIFRIPNFPVLNFETSNSSNF
jgi:hypothetical protein